MRLRLFPPPHRLTARTFALRVLGSSVAILFGSSIAFAQLPESVEVVRGSGFAYGFYDGSTCSPRAIPEAAKLAVDVTIELAKADCLNPEIQLIRILSIEPVACRSWTAGYRAQAEVQYRCRP